MISRWCSNLRQRNIRGIHKKAKNLKRIVLYVTGGSSQDRLDAPGVLHHVIIRGIERRQIFTDDQERDSLVDRLSILFPETQTAYFARVFMSNHGPVSLRAGTV
jgi:hypothetical protein